MTTEAWLRGAIDGIDPLLMPVAHALVQVVDHQLFKVQADPPGTPPNRAVCP